MIIIGVDDYSDLKRAILVPITWSILKVPKSVNTSRRWRFSVKYSKKEKFGKMQNYPKLAYYYHLNILI